MSSSCRDRHDSPGFAVRAGLSPDDRVAPAARHEQNPGKAARKPILIRDCPPRRKAVVAGRQEELLGERTDRRGRSTRPAPQGVSQGQDGDTCPTGSVHTSRRSTKRPGSPPAGRRRAKLPAAVALQHRLGERRVEVDQRPPGQLPGEEGGRCSLQALAQAVQEELVQLVGTDPGQLDGFDLLLAQAGLAKISNRLRVLGPDLLEGSPGCPGGTAE